jgi:dienelactone hydrolase
MPAELAPCCFTGYVKNGSPKGDLRVVGGSRCYLTPKNPNRNVILMCPTIFGIYINSKLYADRLSEETGCTVIIADVFGGADGSGIPVSVMALMNQATAGCFKGKSLLAGLWCAITTYLSLILRIPMFITFMMKHKQYERKYAGVDALLDGMVAERGMKNLVVAGYCYG